MTNEIFIECHFCEVFVWDLKKKSVYGNGSTLIHVTTS